MPKDSKTKANPVKIICPHCNKKVITTPRAFHVILCPECNKIISSDIPLG